MTAIAERWQRLPRDTRDTLFQLGVIAWTLLPHASHLPPWCLLLAAAMLVWRAHLALRAGPLPSRWTVALLLTAAAGMTWFGERTLLGKEAGVTMLVVLVTLKTLELRARRDAMVVFFLGFFLVLTNFLYSQGLLVAVSMLLSVWGLLTALVLAHMPVGRPPLARAGAVAARAALLGAPLMLALFLLFPRMSPLWGMPQDAAGRTGLSGTLRMGGVAEIANDESVAMRLRFDGPVPRPSQMYFRGPVLAAFDGRDWTRLRPSFSRPLQLGAELEVSGAPVGYELTLEPSRLPLLPLLEMSPERGDAAPQVDGYSALLRPDLQWQLDRPVTERLRLRAQAWLQHRHGPSLPTPALRDFVELPAGYNPRTLQWASELRRRTVHADDPRPLVDAVLRHIRDNEFFYSLDPGPYGRDAVDEFWFDRRVGFCEHFAASMVVVLRAMDIPSRLVTGYQGTDPVPVDGYWIVRQSNAHAWVEYWQAGRGWVRVDPTAAVAPERIDGGRSLAPTPGLVAGAIRNFNPALAAQMRDAWEALNNRWNQWVLNYSRTRQFDLLRQLGVSRPSWSDLAMVLIVLLCSVSLAGAAWALWDRRRQDPWQRLQRRVQQRLARLGVTVAPHHAPRGRAGRVRAALGSRGEALALLLEALDEQRYGSAHGGRPERGWWARFRAAERDAAEAGQSRA